ncbi:XkdX family protein [Paenibacillus sp. GM2]|nr:XkdX family protein [Paenibacillus sp. GM2]
MFNSEFERLSYFYEKKWVSDVQLKLYVQFGVITAAEFKVITGKDYKA